ncbi:AAA family ATPase [Peteryoungia ipomoeae]|uniref:Nucleoside kinase n=1 Tax=Peteryoungia ipomoeae TaxID=1210932 RepID=A0A4V4HND8_9HYPH|nr:nucleoside kinase [Peteryoungia ipomoeae]THV25746.1 nucleoside kinase [Peteryoungia ipomoeae]
MAIRNYLIEGVSGAGKTSVATELQRQGYHVLHGDRELAYKGDPITGEPIDLSLLDQDSLDSTFKHRHHVWDVGKVDKAIEDKSHAMAFFCGGSRNFPSFIHLFSAVFVLDVDAETLRKRLSVRPEGEFGSKPTEQEFVLQLLATKEDIPVDAIVIDATAPLPAVVDTILSLCRTSA